MRRQWSEDETSLARSMRENGAKIRAIATALGRSEHSVSERFRWLNLSKERREQRQMRVNLLRREKRVRFVSTPHKDIGYSQSGSRPSRELIFDAQRRLLAPRTITQEIFGDPPPGYSALDRKHQVRPT